MSRLYFIVFTALLCLGMVPPVHADRYTVARIPAPVVNRADLANLFGGNDGRTLKTDRCGQVRELEYIALPGTVFRILEERDAGVYRVETADYQAPPGVALYVDKRFMTPNVERKPPERPRALPKRGEIVAFMKKAIGSPYVWGGNIREGVAELLELNYRGAFSVADRRRLTLAGLDCSGLLYAATGGWTPRNTSQLVAFGRGVPVAGKDAEELAASLEPLDLIVWKGHVIIVLDRETTIESRLECSAPGHGGVMTTPLRRRLTEIMKTRQPLDAWPDGNGKRNAFVVRRWYGQ